MLTHLEALPPVPRAWLLALQEDTGILLGDMDYRSYSIRVNVRRRDPVFATCEIHLMEEHAAIGSGAFAYADPNSLQQAAIALELTYNTPDDWLMQLYTGVQWIDSR